jgi:hypothetical protein
MVGGRRRSCCFWSKVPWGKKKCETVRCLDATASYSVAKFRGEDELFMNNSLDANENVENDLGFHLPLFRLFRSREFRLSVYGSCFLP